MFLDLRSGRQRGRDDGRGRDDKKTRLISVKDILRSDRSWKLMTDYFTQNAGDKSGAIILYEKALAIAPKMANSSVRVNVTI